MLLGGLLLLAGMQSEWHMLLPSFFSTLLGETPAALV